MASGSAETPRQGEIIYSREHNTGSAQRRWTKCRVCAEVFNRNCVVRSANVKCDFCSDNNLPCEFYSIADRYKCFRCYYIGFTCRIPSNSNNSSCLSCVVDGVICSRIVSQEPATSGHRTVTFTTTAASAPSDSAAPSSSLGSVQQSDRGARALPNPEPLSMQRGLTDTQLGPAHINDQLGIDLSPQRRRYLGSPHKVEAQFNGLYRCIRCQGVNEICMVNDLRGCDSCMAADVTCVWRSSMPRATSRRCARCLFEGEQCNLLKGRSAVCDTCKSLPSLGRDCSGAQGTLYEDP
jgi:hypothetical protein